MKTRHILIPILLLLLMVTTANALVIQLQNQSITDGLTYIQERWIWSFDGTNDKYIQVADSNSLDVNQFTFIAFIKTDLQFSNLYGGLWFDQYTFVRNRIMVKNTGEILVQYDVNGTDMSLLSSSIVQANKWIMIVVQYDGSQFRVYGNLTLAGTYNITGPISISASPRIVGKGYSNTYFFKGSMASAYLYNKSLSTTELNQMLNAFFYGNTSIVWDGLVLYLDADAYDGVKYVDLSGYGNDGASYGGLQRVLRPESEWGLRYFVNPNLNGSVGLYFFPINTQFNIYYEVGRVYSFYSDSYTEYVSLTQFNLNESYVVRWDTEKNVFTMYPVPREVKIIEPGKLLDPRNAVDWWSTVWSPIGPTIWLLIPVSIYLKTRHPGLTAGSALVVSLAGFAIGYGEYYLVIAAAAISYLLFIIFFRKRP